MARKRFNADEKALLASLAPGARIEWQHGSHWLPATIISNTISTSDGGWQTVGIVCGKTTRTVRAGQCIPARSGQIRAVPAPVTMLDTFRAASDAYRGQS